VVTTKQRKAAKKNVRKAISTAKRKKTIARMPKKTRTALGQAGIRRAQAEADRRVDAEDTGRADQDRPAAGPRRPVEDGA
jgi:hypothetical protein